MSGSAGPIGPAGRGEVRGFGDVEAVVEARVVRVWERDHELAGLVDARVIRDAIFLEPCGREHEGFVPHELSAVGRGLRLHGSRHRLEAQRVFRFDGVPRLGGAVVQVVDRVEIHVLDMIGEHGRPHAHVEHCVGNTGHGWPNVALQKCVQVIHIPPRREVVVEKRATSVGAVHGRIHGRRQRAPEAAHALLDVHTLGHVRREAGRRFPLE
mmetsp:Transcript_2153/g.4694  ORF Transcript_2153/g.4694 Transcript_2153/m.4694 type:complete len:211 (-) Transcript_2153:360-992(-)